MNLSYCYRRIKIKHKYLPLETNKKEKILAFNILKNILGGTLSNLMIPLLATNHILYKKLLKKNHIPMVKNLNIYQTACSKIQIVRQHKLMQLFEESFSSL